MNVITKPAYLGARDPLSTGILPETLDATIVLPFNDAYAVEQALREFDVAALIVEAIPHNIGCVLPKPDFFPRLRELCTQTGTVFIMDEVVTGFRHALGGYQSLLGVVPDLTVLGKAMGNGYPIAAIGGREDLMDLFSTTPGHPVFFGGTYNGHPAMVAAALATIDKLEREPVHDHIFRLGEQTRAGLIDVYRELGVPAIVTGFGSIFVSYFMTGAIDSYADLVRNDADLFVRYRRRLIERHHIFEMPINLKRSQFSYAHRAEHVGQLLEATRTALRDTLTERKATTGS
jgi:glutamate-1-semialdehyde 2,1-aminomutase